MGQLSLLDISDLVSIDKPCCKQKIDLPCIISYLQLTEGKE